MNNEINIIFLGEMSSGKTTLISCILNNMIGTIKRSKGTEKITIYNNGFIPSFMNDNYNHIIINNSDLDIQKFKINVIDTIGFNDLIHDEFMITEFNKLKPHLDIIIFLIDCNTCLDKKSENDILNLIKDFDNILYVINKFDDPDDVELIENIGIIKTKLNNPQNIISLSADTILICKSIIHNFTEKIIKKKLTIFEKLYDCENINDTLKSLRYNDFIDLIKIIINPQKIIEKKINMFLESNTSINKLINYITDINNMYDNIITNNMFKIYLNILVKKYTQNILDINVKKQNINILLDDIHTNIDFIKNNITLQHYIINMLDLYISYFKCELKNIQCAARLSEINMLYDKILINLMSKIEINKKNYENIIQYLILLDKDLRKHKLIMIDEIIYKLLNYELTTFTQTKKLYILNHLTMYFDKYIINLPISSKLRYYTFQITNDLITNNRHNIIYERTKTLELIDIIIDVIIDDKIIKSNKLITDKRKFIKKMIHENFVIFPCINKLPCIKGWNKISKNNSIKTYSGNNKMPEKYEDMYINDNLYKNIGLLCGTSSNIFIIDIDNKDNGMTYWNNLLDKYNNSKDIDTLKVITGSKGKHYYFKMDNTERFYTKNKIFSTELEKIGIDIRRDDGYIIAPFSQHENNNCYYFENYDDTKTIREQINMMPEWLYNELNNYYEVNNKDNKNDINNNNDIDNKIENNENNIDEYVNIFDVSDNKDKKKLKIIKN